MLIYTYGDASQFTAKIQAGHVTNDIADILNPEIVSQAISATHQTVREGKSVLFKHVYEAEDDEGVIESWSLKCFTFKSKAPSVEGDVDLVALSFLRDKEFVSRDAEVEYDVDQQVKNRIAELDISLVECQRLYRETLEDLDSTREELQSSNEELMAANEELQSTNEELQSVNEELYTVNSEYQQKIVELTSINNDLENLLKATRLAVIFLDKDLRIRRFTDAVKEYINVIDFDVERLLFDLTFKYDFEGLNEMIERVNTTGKTTLKNFDLVDNKRVEISITPYQLETQNNGVVISIRELLISG
ncbi:PAS domain-containing protein [Algibacillus agarilyticus]|uniref:PAS domain-containing protein n=1 Tax=Algibacillus agarilyticus TaxID=2234133 RepID=UPI001E5863A3|nr:PAS domain-containing protein [Algibacillus agarilyticus]